MAIFLPYCVDGFWLQDSQGEAYVTVHMDPETPTEDVDTSPLTYGVYAVVAHVPTGSAVVYGCLLDGGDLEAEARCVVEAYKLIEEARTRGV